MKKRVTIIIPRSEKLKGWLEQLLELNLLANIEIVQVEWHDIQTGTQNDWSGILSLVLQEWEQTEGFVIWAPEQSLLNLASYLSLSFNHPGKPIVLFSAPAPETNDKFSELGLKSVLINACYASLSEMAEVAVLSGNRLFRAQDCVWSQEGSYAAVTSEQNPLAVIEFGLNFTGPYLQRSTMKPLSKNPVALESKIRFQQKVPGQQLQSETFSPSVRAVFLQSMESLWNEHEIASVRSLYADNPLPVVWFRETPWKIKNPLDHELFISHSQSWWAAFLTQMAFGFSSSTQEAFDFIRKRL